MARRAPPRDLRREMALSRLMQTMLPRQLDDRSEDVAAEEDCIKTELGQHAALLFHGTHLHVLIFDTSILNANVPGTGEILPETGCRIVPTDPSHNPNDSPWQRFHLQDPPAESPSDSCSEEQKYLRSSHLALYRGRQYYVLFYDPSVLDITWAGWNEEESVVLLPAEGLRVVPRKQLNQSRNRPMWIRFKLETEEPAAKVHPKPASVAQPSALHSVPDHPDTSGDPRHIARSGSATRSAGDWPAARDATEQPKQSSDQQTKPLGSSSASFLTTSRRCQNGGFLSAEPYSSTSEPGACGACFDRRRHSGDVIRDTALHQLHSAMNRIHVGPQRRASFAFEKQNVKDRPDSVPIITDVLAGSPSVPIRRSSANMPPGVADAIAITEPVTPTRITAPRIPGDERGSTHQPTQPGVPWAIAGSAAIFNSPSRSNQPISPIPTSPSILRAALETGINITSPRTSRVVPTMSPRSIDQAKTSQPESTIQLDVAKFQKMEVDDPKGKQPEEKMDVDDETQPPETVKPVTRSGQSQKSAKSQESWTKPSTRSGMASPQKPSTSKPESLLKQAISRKQSETESSKVGRKRSTRKGSESSETETDSDVQTRTRVTRGAKDRKESKSEQSEESGSEGQSKRGSSADKAKKAAKGTPRKQTKASTSNAAEGTSGEDPDVKGTPRKTRATDTKSEEPSKKSADTPLRKSSRLNKNER